MKILAIFVLEIRMGTNSDHTPCYHCGEDCLEETILHDDKSFCCNGCKTVFEILDASNLTDYYSIERTPGISPGKSMSRYEYLDETSVIDQLLQFRDDRLSVVTFYMPAIHCSSCVWLLENLYKLNDHVQSSRVNFLRKEVKISFLHQEMSLRQLVELLASIGYTPQINLDKGGENSARKVDRKLIYRLGVAGFCFGNVMLLSMPEYLGMTADNDEGFTAFFGYINILLSLPILLYSASDYFRSALLGLRQKKLNIDVPISLGILVLFFRSSYEIIAGTGAGYLDSLAGLIFFLLLGRVFQQKTYNTLSFERDYKSYFPIAVSRLNKDGTEKSTPVADIQKGDRILIRNREIIPVDGVLESELALIDNSFVTGESREVPHHGGDKVYAGGRLLGQSVVLTVLNPLSQSYLTRLWNDDAFQEEKEDRFDNLTNKMSVYFTMLILLIAFGGLFYWLQSDTGKAVNVFTAVLIIACPCALALSAPFTFGNTLRIFGRNKFYLKNVSVIERLGAAHTLIFDKTGTITRNSDSHVTYHGNPLSTLEKEMISSVLRESNHPLSKLVLSTFEELKLHPITAFEEVQGAGMKATVLDHTLLIGSASLVGAANVSQHEETRVYISINSDQKGYFTIQNEYRENLQSIIASIKPDFDLKVLSGDNEGEREKLKEIFGPETEMVFNQSPEEKLKFVKNVQEKQQGVVMFGDGLNDAGALRQAEVGISVSEDINTFSPASDAILDAGSFDKIPLFYRFSKNSIQIVITSFIISFLYNLVGLFFAIQGILSPITAAILMPLSSITVVVFVTLATRIRARVLGL